MSAGKNPVSSANQGTLRDTPTPQSSLIEAVVASDSSAETYRTCNYDTPY